MSGKTAEEAKADVLGLTCPKCGQPSVECKYWDSGAGHYWFDNYRHACTNPTCDYKEELLDKYGGDAPYEHDWLACPFCQRSRPSETRVLQGKKCVKCRKDTAVCVYYENGPPLSYIDNFSHVCTDKECGHKEERLNINAGELGQEDQEPYCPLCKAHKCIGSDCRCKQHP